MIATANLKMLKAAQLELLIADNFNESDYLHYKLNAYIRATEYYFGMFPKNIHIFDTYSALCDLQPGFLDVLLDFMKIKNPEIQISCLNGIFMLMTYLGCSLSTKLCKIFIVTCLTDSLSEEFMSLKKNILNSIINILNSASSLLINEFYHDAIIKVIQFTLCDDIKLIFIKTVLITFEICENNLDVDPGLLTIILRFAINGKDFYSVILWNKLKHEVFPKYSEENLNKIIEWSLQYLNIQKYQECCEVLDAIILILSCSRSIMLCNIKELNEKCIQIFNATAFKDDLIDLAKISWKCIAKLCEFDNSHNIKAILFKILSHIELLSTLSEFNGKKLEFSSFFIEYIPYSSDLDIQLLRLLIVISNSIPGSIDDCLFKLLENIIILCKPLLVPDDIHIFIINLLGSFTLRSQNYWNFRKKATQFLCSEETIFEFTIQECFYLLTKIFEGQNYQIEREKIQQIEMKKAYLDFFISLLSTIKGKNLKIILKNAPKIIEICSMFLNDLNFDIKFKSLEILKNLLAMCKDIETTVYNVIFLIISTLKNTLEVQDNPKLIFFLLQLIYMIFARLLVADDTIANERVQQILILWPFIEKETNSHWINISNISFLIINSWALSKSTELNSYLYQFIFSLLSCGEHFKKQNGLKIIANYCGLNEFSKTISEIHSNEIPIHIWKQIIVISNDYCQKTRRMAEIIIDLCLSSSMTNRITNKIKEKDKILDVENHKEVYDINNIIKEFQIEYPEQLEIYHNIEGDYRVAEDSSVNLIEIKKYKNAYVLSAAKTVIKKRLPLENNKKNDKANQIINSNCKKTEEKRYFLEDQKQLFEGDNSEALAKFAIDSEKLLKIPPKLPKKRLEMELSSLLRNLASPIRGTTQLKNKDEKLISLNKSLNTPYIRDRDIRINCN